MPTAAEILTAAEIQQVLAHTSPYRGHWRPNTLINRVIFRLSCCCGLRRKEIACLKIGDVFCSGERPCLRISSSGTKRSAHTGKGKNRTVPLYWDEGTREDIAAWLEIRTQSHGAKLRDPFLVAPHARPWGKAMAALSVSSVWRRWKTATRCLPADRQRLMHLHCGRHTYISWLWHVGVPPVEIMQAAGHSSLATSTIYAHLVEGATVRDIFAKTTPTTRKILAIGRKSK